MVIKQSKTLFCNGYGFDELSPGLIMATLEYAVDVGTSIFFDPGPRGKSLSTGTVEERRTLSELLKMSDVLLVTSDEVWFTTLLYFVSYYLLLLVILLEARVFGFSSYCS